MSRMSTTKTHVNTSLFLIDNLIQTFICRRDAGASRNNNHMVVDIDDEKEDALASDCDTAMVPECPFCGAEIQSTFLDTKGEGFACDHCDAIGVCEKCVTTNIGRFHNELVNRLIVECDCCVFENHWLYDEDDEDDSDEDDEDNEDDEGDERML